MSIIVRASIHRHNKPLVTFFPCDSAINEFIRGLNDVNFPSASVPKTPNSQIPPAGPLEHKRRVILPFHVFNQRNEAFSSCIPTIPRDKIHWYTNQFFGYESPSYFWTSIQVLATSLFAPASAGVDKSFVSLMNPSTGFGSTYSIGLGASLVFLAQQ